MREETIKFLKSIIRLIVIGIILKNAVIKIF